MRIVSGREVVDWVAQHIAPEGSFSQTGLEMFGLSVGIGIERDGKLVAGCVMNEFNGVNANLHVASVGRGWCSRTWLWFCFHYAFNQACVNRVTGLVAEGNFKSRRFCERLGFELETRLKKATPTGDLLVYRMTRENCKWLRRPKHEQNMGSGTTV